MQENFAGRRGFQQDAQCGHADEIRRVVGRINDIDRLANRRIVLEQPGQRGWRVRTEEDGIEAAA